jgi:pseudaminic acid cytidylyltransferase
MKIAVIPARGGSKRIARKNIADFRGKPIISYSIEAAQKAKIFDKIIVSTDDQEIAAIATKYGAEVPFIRPSGLADDFTPLIDVLIHAVTFFSQQNLQVEYVCNLFATAPFLVAEDIKSGFNILKEREDFDYCLSLTSFPSAIQRSLKLVGNGGVEMNDLGQFTKRTQDLKEFYHDAAQFFWAKVKPLMNKNSVFTGNTLPHLIPNFRVQDIDTQDDWRRAEFLHEILCREGLI